MKKVQGFAALTMMFAVMCMSVMIVGVSQAQTDLASFTGKFVLTTQVQWDKTTLPPGKYTVTVESHGAMTLAFVTSSKGGLVGFFMSGICGGKKSDRNALLLRERDGQLRVYSLELASLGKVLVYDPALAQEAAMEARAPQAVPVMLAKR